MTNNRPDLPTSIAKGLKHHAMTRGVLESLLQIRCRNTKAFVFVANPGRSGSKTLADIFAGVPGLAVSHEPTPKMTFEPEWGTSQEQNLRALFFEKKIFYVMRAAAGHSHYIETNHLFIKTFAEHAIGYFGDRIRIIHLRRDPVSVALSFYRLGEIAGQSEVERRYMLDPLAADNIVPGAFLLEPKSPYGHEFYRNLWYWYEVEARIAAARRKHPRTRWIDFHTDDLNRPVAVRALCEQLEIVAHVEQILDRVGTRSNSREAEKQARGSDRAQLDLRTAREMDRALRVELQRRGVALPPCNGVESPAAAGEQ
jgi:hypothetical protein